MLYVELHGRTPELTATTYLWWNIFHKCKPMLARCPGIYIHWLLGREQWSSILTIILIIMFVQPMPAAPHEKFNSAHTYLPTTSCMFYSL